MIQNRLLGSQSNPMLVTSSSQVNMNSSTANLFQSSASVGDLNAQHINTSNSFMIAVNNVEEIRQTDLRLQSGIYDAREKLIRAIKTN